MAGIASTGIYVVCGKPGSGKSYTLVRMMLEEILRAGRVVYTNLPIEWKTTRAYIMRRAHYLGGWSKGKARVRANYIRPLTKDHFERFTRRLSRLDEISEGIQESSGVANDLTANPEFLEEQARERARLQVIEEMGPEIVSGPGANWIPPLSVVMLDELHKWYGNASRQKEPEEILKYTSMHRHLLHKVYVISQRAKNVSLSFREMAAEFWLVENLRNTRGLWAFKFPLQAFRVAKFYSGDVRNGEISPGTRPLSVRTFFPQGGNKVFFRLYRSHAHLVSLEAAHKEAASLRAGLEGRQNMDMPKSTEKRLWLWSQFLWWPTRKIKYMIPLAIVAMFAWSAGRAAGGGDRGDLAQAGQVPAASVDLSRSDESTGPEWDFTLGSLSSDGVFVNGQLVQIGGRYAEFELVRVQVATGWTVWRFGDFMFMRHVDGRLWADERFMERLEYFRESNDSNAFRSDLGSPPPGRTDSTGAAAAGRGASD